VTQQDEQRTGYRVAKQQRPRCPLHGCLMRVESSKGPVGYAYCPVDGCCQAAKVIREKIADD
jgi:hypothetical protein